jgi:antitoxin component YwqK of YwqJK toxin-antitoxin module/Tfp pilus assembly protein PilF
MFLLASFCSTNLMAQQTPPLINSGELLREGYNLYKNENYKEALKKYHQINRSDTNYAKALHEIANAYYADSQYNEAIATAQLGLKLFPEKFSDFSMIIANTYDNGGKMDEAIKVYDEAIQATPQFYLLYFNRGICNIRKEDYAAAKADLQKALLINPYFSQSHYFMGNLYFLEGSMVPAILSYSSYLMIAPEGKYKSNAIQLLSQISKVTDEVQELSNKKSSSTEKSFNQIQSILLSKIALDPKYKSLVDIDDNIVKQLQVVVEKLEFKKSDKGFAMQYYVPLFTTVFKDKMFPAMIYTMFGGIELDEITNWTKKNKAQKDAFINVASSYFNDIKYTQILEYENRDKAEKHYLYNDGDLIGYGKIVSTKKETIPVGDWVFFNDLYGKVSEGKFDENGKKTGNWKFYHSNGQLKELFNYNNGLPEGKCKGWYNNGNLSYEESYSNGKLNGKQTIYYYNEIVKSVLNYDEDNLEGEAKYYSYKGKLTTVAQYSNNKPNGLYKTYHDNGKIKDEGSYVNGDEEGNYKAYYISGKLRTTGMVKKNKREGLWTEYFENGQEKYRSMYQDGEITGAFTEYYNNGQLSVSGNYVKKKLDGTVLYYNRNGVKYCEATYDKGRLREIKFFDNTGKQISSTTTRKGAANITFYNADGVKTSEGSFDKEGFKQGTFTDYFPTGKVSTISNWKDGELHGSYLMYEPNGNKIYEGNYSNDNEDGFIRRYYHNGKIKEEGWVIDGKKQQTWTVYNINGDLYSKKFYLNGDPDGYTEYFYPGNVKDYEYRFKTDWLTQMTQYDSTGKIISEGDFPKGNGKLIFKHFNGKVLSETELKNFMSNGVKKSYFFDGKQAGFTTFINDDKHGAYKNYFYNGNISSEGEYQFNEKEGVWKTYYRVGGISSEETFVNGKKEGQDKYYAKNGNLSRTVDYRNDVVHGNITTYGDNNEIALMVNFDDGFVTGYQYLGSDNKPVSPIPLIHNSGKVKATYPNGKTSAEFTYYENNIEGNFTYYYSNGNVKIKGKMKNGYYDGTIEFFYPDGKKEKTENYIMGNLYGKTTLYFQDGKIEAELNYYDAELHGDNIYYNAQTGKPVRFKYYHGYIISIQE